MTTKKAAAQTKSVKKQYAWIDVDNIAHEVGFDSEARAAESGLEELDNGAIIDVYEYVGSYKKTTEYKKV